MCAHADRGGEGEVWERRRMWDIIIKSTGFQLKPNTAEFLQLKKEGWEMEDRMGTGQKVRKERSRTGVRGKAWSVPARGVGGHYGRSSACRATSSYPCVTAYANHPKDGNN